MTAPSSSLPSDQTLDGVALLPHLGVIRAQGEEAAKFLHGQLTQDFELLDLNHARLAALCTAKGRMLASFVGFKRSKDEILLVMSRDILAQTLKRLSMFVLRAKVKLTDASAEFELRGLAGNAAQALAGNASAAWNKTDLPEGACAVTLYPAMGQERALWIAPAGVAAPSGPELSTADWQWAEVQSGVATISSAVVEAFVPQMLNYESVGGVNFKKGCYPGQEIVARSQFRGTLKRRAFVVHAPDEVVSGQEVFAAADAEQPVGTVVQSAKSGNGGWDAIVSLQLSAVHPDDGGTPSLHAASAQGPALQLQPLPYELLEDI